MIASYNIKVNGRWVRAGEEYGESGRKPEKEVPQEEPKAKMPEPVKEEDAVPEKEEPKKTPSRRKKVSE